MLIRDVLMRFYSKERTNERRDVLRPLIAILDPEPEPLALIEAGPSQSSTSQSLSPSHTP